MDELRIVGKNIPRIDSRDKVTGTAKYTDDLWQYETLYCKLLRSHLAHARILSIDTSQAEKLDGVKAVLTYKDVPQVLFGEDGADDAYVLTDRARFAGDEVAAVAAVSEDIAERALELIDVKYEELPIVLTVEQALKPDAPLIPPPQCSKSNLLKNPVRTTCENWGNVDEGFKEANQIFEDNYSTHFIQHVPMEPRAFLASWDNGKLTIWAGTSRPFQVRSSVAKVLGMPETKVRIITPYVGGGFGSKGWGRYPMIVALLAKKANRPVKLSLTREEDLLSRTRPATDIQLKLGVKKDGSFKAIDAKLTVNAGAYNWSLTTTALVPLRTMFRCDNCRLDARSVYTNHPPTGQMRGVLNTAMSFALTQLADRIAQELGFESPIKFIKKTHLRAGDPCGTEPFMQGVTCSSCGLVECIEKGASAIGWEEKWKGWKTPVAISGHKRTGMGMAAVVHDSAHPITVSGAVLKVNMDGTADFFTPVSEIGNGAMTTQTQVVAEASGIPMEDIQVINADTEVTPVDSMGQVASSTAHVRSLAAKLAGEDAKRQMLEYAADGLKVKPEALDLKEGKIYVKSEPSRSMTIKSLMSQVEFGMIPPVVGRGTVACPRWPQKAYNFGAHFAIVEVDTMTGEIKVVKYVAAHDVGKALNPQVVESQIYGGVIMGLSTTLKEELIFNPDGKPLNANFTDYKIFTTGDRVDVIPIIVESNDPLGAYGAKGFGEAPLIGVPGCIANAIYNATGIRFKELPITPEKVLKALRDKGLR